MENKHRAMIFFAVMFFVLILVIFWEIRLVDQTAGQAVALQHAQMSKAKECSNNCDSLAESSGLNCDWIECHEKCQIGAQYPYCSEQS